MITMLLDIKSIRLHEELISVVEIPGLKTIHKFHSHIRTGSQTRRDRFEGRGHKGNQRFIVHPINYAQGQDMTKCSALVPCTACRHNIYERGEPNFTSYFVLKWLTIIRVSGNVQSYLLRFEYNKITYKYLI
jgi:hypothetical protein